MRNCGHARIALLISLVAACSSPKDFAAPKQLVVEPASARDTPVAPAAARLEPASVIHDDFVPDPRDAKWGQLRVALTTGMGRYMGQDMLVFALYSNGRVLFGRSSSGYRPTKYASLSPAQVRALLDDLPLDRVGRYRWTQPDGADGATDCVHVWDENGHRRACDWPGFSQDPGVVHDPAPAQLRRIWARLEGFDDPSAKTWVPDRVEVALFPYDCSYTVPPARKWPAAWPRPVRNTSKTYPRLFATASLPGAALALVELNAADRGKWGGCPPPFAIDGAHYSVRASIPLPSDGAWRTRPAPGHGEAPIFEASSASSQNRIAPRRAHKVRLRSTTVVVHLRAFRARGVAGRACGRARCGSRVASSLAHEASDTSPR